MTQTDADQPLPLALFDYELPPERIAHEPMRPRDASRLLVLDRRSGRREHRIFHDLPDLLAPGDLLVANRTRVIRARLRLTRPTGGRVELLVVRPLDGDVVTARRWEALGRPKKALRPGQRLCGPDGVELEVEERRGETVVVRGAAPLWPLLEAHGEVPLPPYIERAEGRAADRDDYQTIFAADRGAIAAPTAGLHFTARLLEAIAEREVGRADVVLHVGPGTFLPVRPEVADDVRDHHMHREWYDVPADTQAAVLDTRARGGRVVAVGTTCVRALETWHRTGHASGESELFIYPGYAFGYVDALVTNFHLPRSTLIMLVAALAGRQSVFDAYTDAIERGYRFYSYGDAMLIV